MKLSINFRNMKGTGKIIQYIDYRTSFAFSRLDQGIDSTSVILEDVNGPKSGVDKQCKVIIKPTGMQRIVITETRANWKQAIDRCMSRASQSLARKLKRRKDQLKKVGYGDMAIAQPGY